MTAAQIDSGKVSNALLLAEIVTPGDIIACEATYLFNGEMPAMNAYLTIDVHPLGVVNAHSLRVDGIELQHTGAGSRVTASLPPIKPGQALAIEWTATLPLGTPNGAAADVDLTIVAGASKTTLSGTMHARSSASISRERSVIAAAAEKPGTIGQEYVLNVALFNEGTASARSVVFEVDKQKDVSVSGLPMLSDIPPRDTHVCALTVVPNGPKPQLTLRAKHADGSTVLAPFDFIAKKGPALRGKLEIDGEMPTPVSGGIIPVRVTIENTGDTAAENPRLLLDLPTGVRLHNVSIRERNFLLPTIDPGGAIERTLLLAVDEMSEAFLIQARPTTDFKTFDDLEPLKLQPLRVASCVISDFVPTGPFIAGQAFETTLLLTFDGNATAEQVVVRVSFGDPLAFAGDLRVNGAPIDYTLDDQLVFENVEPGTDVELTWQTIASRGTMRGSTTSMTALVDIEGVRIEGSTSAIRVKQSVQKARSFGDLPFRVSGAKKGYAVAQVASPAPAAPVAPTVNPTLNETIEGKHAAPETASPQDSGPNSGGLAQPDATALRALRPRLAVAGGARSSLQTVIFSLAALADAGTHPDSDTYAKAVFALRRAVTESSNGPLKLAITKKLREDLAPFAALVDGEEVSLLEGLAAIADAIGASSNADVGYWESVRTFGQRLSDMLRQAATSEPDLEEDPNGEHPALADVKSLHAHMTLQIPT